MSRHRNHQQTSSRAASRIVWVALASCTVALVSLNGCAGTGSRTFKQEDEHTKTKTTLSGVFRDTSYAFQDVRRLSVYTLQVCPPVDRRAYAWQPPVVLPPDSLIDEYSRYISETIADRSSDVAVLLKAPVDEFVPDSELVVQAQSVDGSDAVLVERVFECSGERETMGVPVLLPAGGASLYGGHDAQCHATLVSSLYDARSKTLIWSINADTKIEIKESKSILPSFKSQKPPSVELALQEATFRALMELPL